MTRINRFTVIERMFHLFLILTFLVQTVTGFSRLFISTIWGKNLTAALGGAETSITIHKWIGILMIAGFMVHTLYLLTRINWGDLKNSLFGPDSLIPNRKDAKDLWKRIQWFFGLGEPPRMDRWAYWEKFDYWAVYWGMPLLAVTGLMLMYPILTSRIMPGWTINIAVLLHRAEAILAITYIFIVHFYIGHLRPTSFPMNEVMFSGSLPLEEIQKEKPAWAARLNQSDALNHRSINPPARWYRVFYYVFGYAVLGFGIYLLINGIIYSRYIPIH
ncbi:MAG: cytochrome C [Desulfobacteraceae bacterium]|nr:MAG: cytochrome C [Desulfobacteraceae bacterium]